MQSSHQGIVYLVGAGPGDPGLLTLRGAELLSQADVVIYDYLSSPQLLVHCPQAQTIYVGKKAAEHTLTQEEINALLIEKAKAGHRVVRLKGGDPFVFGRGGEECLALHAAGIPFEVVPGITAAIAAPAYAGIPVTHRDLNSTFTFVTGHEKEEQYQDPQAAAREAGAASDLDWASLAKMQCVAFYMGVKALPRICQKLIDNGMPSDMPAATIRWGTTWRHRSVIATLADLPQRVAESGLGPPALTIIGRVVALSSTLNWFEKRPLFGRTIVTTRTRQQASDLTAQLTAMGARVIEAPTIEVCPPDDWTAVDAALREMGTFDWVIFTSQNGVKATRARLDHLGLDARAFGKAKIAAIGPATAASIPTDLCLRVDVCPQTFVAEALADELLAAGKVADKRFLLLRADIARPLLAQRLESAGAALVRDISVYETRIASSLPQMLHDALEGRQVDWITFTSSSTARNFVTLLGGDLSKLAGIKIASIGPVTTETLQELGLAPTVQAKRFDISGLVDAIVEAK